MTSLKILLLLALCSSVKLQQPTQRRASPNNGWQYAYKSRQPIAPRIRENKPPGGSNYNTVSNPCSCSWNRVKCGCLCLGSLSEDQFQSLALKFAPCDNFNFKLSDGNYFALPPNLFSRVGRVRNFFLDISEAKFQHLFDPTPGTSAFRGVKFEENAAIRLSNVSAARSWNWTPLSELDSVYGKGVDVEIVGSRLRRLSSDFSRIASGAVDKVKIADSSLEMVAGGTFSTFSNISHLLLPRNQLRSLRRLDLPKLASKLVEIDLSKNELLSLEPAMFSSMPSLRRVHLEGNPIRMIGEETFKPILGRAFISGLSGFPLECDCRLRWVKETPMDFTYTFQLNLRGATCRKPSHLRGTPLKYLSAEHLLC